MSTQESIRLMYKEKENVHPWKKWGPYVSERAWGTVREDYSANGDAWNYFTHDMARSRSYRWSEDGIAGICDFFQMVAFSIALWNGKDPILKERLFGLNPYEGNHGEDVKEYYFYLDSTPTHSYMKYLYKYPHKEFPYQKLVDENKRRGTLDREYELLDTGIFAENRYFDVFIEYAKADVEDIVIRIEICNRGPENATCHLLPQLLFRNRWSWEKNATPPEIKVGESGKDFVSLYVDPTNLPPIEAVAYPYQLDPLYLYAEKGANLLFTNNETNTERLYKVKNQNPYVKDAFHRQIIHKENCTNPEKKGTKAGIHFESEIPALGSKVFYLRLTKDKLNNPFKDAEKIVSLRKKEADDFYNEIQASFLSEEDKKIQRQALSGLLWSKQYYRYHVQKWFSGDPVGPAPAESREEVRNYHWGHLNSNHIFSMPDKWEYPWFAAWDLAFQSVALAGVDIDFAKEQIHILLKHQYQHPNGQIPAYEWGFSDLNPPVQAWALWRIYCMDKKQDLDFLEINFLKLMCNFSWWVNKVDKEGNNFFEGGFLGLDNISIIDRSKRLSDGGFFEESDGTGWMGFFALYMMKIALELSKKRPRFEGMALLYFEHFVYIASALHNSKQRSVQMWDDEDGFFYDVISYPDSGHKRLKIRSFVGVIPFYSIDFLDEDDIKQLPRFYENFQLFLKEKAELCKQAVEVVNQKGKKRYLLSLMNQAQIKKVFNKVWSPEEFFSKYGLRSISKFHEKSPLNFEGSRVSYEPGESLERIKGGNSNWRGPIWFPTNFLVLESLNRLEEALGDSMNLQTKSGAISLKELSESLRNSLIDLFREANGKKPVHGDYEIFQKDPYWKDLLLFYEHYHGDIGRGLGASHQTGWSGLVATLIAEKKKK